MDEFDLKYVWDEEGDEILHPEDIIDNEGLEYLRELYSLVDSFYQDLPYDIEHNVVYIEEILEEWLDTTEPYLLD